MTALIYFLEEGGWNWLVSLIGVKQLTDRGGAKEVVRL